MKTALHALADAQREDADARRESAEKTRGEETIHATA
jgi:hypothetical protein